MSRILAVAIFATLLVACTGITAMPAPRGTGEATDPGGTGTGVNTPSPTVAPPPHAPGRTAGTGDRPPRHPPDSATARADSRARADSIARADSVRRDSSAASPR